MIILLGLLIFVHELGHFLVAKYFKVRVEVFSLGFGKKLLSFRRGDTEYCIAAIPLGGYVKMFGDDPSAEISEVDRQGSFLHKPVGQRIAVVLAGPLMNLLFAFILYSAIAMMGEKAIFPGLGDIDSKSMAAAAGFQSGDTVLEIVKADGKVVMPLTWTEFEKPIQDSPEQKLSFKVQRASGEVAILEATPKFVPNPFILGWKREVGGIDGLSFISRASSIAVISSESAAAKAGLKTGDTITKIGDTPIRRWRELLSSAETFANAAGFFGIQLCAFATAFPGRREKQRDQHGDHGCSLGVSLNTVCLWLCANRFSGKGTALQALSVHADGAELPEYHSAVSHPEGNDDSRNGS